MEWQHLSMTSHDPEHPDEAAEAVEVRREGLTMALYVSLSLLAVMAALPTSQVEESSNLALTIVLTSIGLVFAHQVAFRLSSRVYAPDSTLSPIAGRILTAQLAGGALITALAVVPILLFGPGAFRVSGLLLLLFVLVVGYYAARSAPHTRARSLAYVAGVAAIVGLVLLVKSLVGH